jgi:hypothetical protein
MSALPSADEKLKYTISMLTVNSYFIFYLTETIEKIGLAAVFVATTQPAPRYKGSGLV